MIPLHNLKLLLQKDYDRRTILALLLASYDEPEKVKELKTRAKELGYRKLEAANVSRDLQKSGYAIRINDGWELSEAGVNHIISLGIKIQSNEMVELADDLRGEAENIANNDTKSFVMEAICAYENDLKRSAIVMSWLGAVSVLHHEVFTNHLSAFNIEATRRKSKWKTAQTVDDLCLMTERDFLDIIQHISIIGKDVKTALIECLSRRNSCGHPNSFQISNRIVAAHLETLILNVYMKF